MDRRKPDDDPWSPVELLEAFLEEVKAGRIKPSAMMVFYMNERPGGALEPQTWACGVTHAQAIAYCQLEIQRTIEEWRM